MSVADLARLDGIDLIRAVLAAYPGQVAVTSSFGAESAVLLDLVAQVDPSVPVIFLDTGELFDETISYRDQLAARLGLTDLRVVSPTPEDKAAAEDLWRSDADLCCDLRKVRPMARAVAPFTVLIDGRKRSHGAERGQLPSVQQAGPVLKVSPLAHWDQDRLDQAFKDRDLPTHPLVAQGYRSIGCWPCTRPTQPGESPRAGRWAGSAKSECGIHTMVLGQDGAGI